MGAVGQLAAPLFYGAHPAASMRALIEAGGTRMRRTNQLAMFLMAMTALPLRAAVTPADIARFMADSRDLKQTSTPRQGLVYRSLERTRSVPATAAEIAATWKIPEPVATQLVEGL